MSVFPSDAVVAFQGAPYAFSEIAIKKYFVVPVSTLPCRTFEEVFQAVDSGQAYCGMVPIENSLTGSIHRNYDLLLEHKLSIIAEAVLPIDQCLIANPGVKLDEIELIYSHPQALEQCRQFLASLKNVEAVASYDTAGSALMIRDRKLRNAAAIAGKWAARDLGLEVLKEDIQDLSPNFTRFFLVSRQGTSLETPTRTSIVFSMKNIPGALFKALSVFALRDIDLFKIESRPLRNRPWDYFFYLTFVGTLEEERCRNALRHLGEITFFVTLLGSYASRMLDNHE
ncbi:prephenate dehydratase [candidate division KSB1 bacterium]|nr:prephenate dehydratase [candidate division KSB1 bacterium]